MDKTSGLPHTRLFFVKSNLSNTLGVLTPSERQISESSVTNITLFKQKFICNGEVFPFRSLLYIPIFSFSCYIQMLLLPVAATALVYASPAADSCCPALPFILQHTLFLYFSRPSTVINNPADFATTFPFLPS